MKGKKIDNVCTTIFLFLFLFVGIQPALAIVHIPDDTSVGVWDNTTSTFTLTTDINDSVQIRQDNMTLDGDGHKITVGPQSYSYGVYLSDRSGVTIKNLIVEGGYQSAILMQGVCNSNTIQNNGLSGNQDAISALQNTGQGNKYLNNDLSDSTGYSLRIGNDPQFEVSGNDFTNSAYGIQLSYMDDVSLSDVNVDLSTIQHTAVYLAYITNSSVSNITTNAGTAVQITEGGGNTISGVNASWGGGVGYGWGIRIIDSSNNTIQNCTIDDYRTGIRLGTQTGTCSSNAIQNVSLSGNTDNGILLSGTSNSNTITDVTIANVGYTGIRISSSVGGNHISAAEISLGAGSNGILLERSSNDTIDNCTITGSSIGIGIYLATAGYNTIQNNTVSGCYKGLYLNGAYDNEIYNNNFIDNIEQARVAYDSTGNVFNRDKPIGGNYWSDWTSPDNDGDGFVDFPYVFTGGQDNLPWVHQDGWLDPAAAITALIATVEAMNLQQGIENSLDAKLENALAALDAANAGNRNDAICKIEAFINEVKAQRGNKLTEDQADELVAAANNIIDLITALGGTAAPVFAQETPSEWQLDQNYPNPFNPDTWIPYQLKQDANVVISVYSPTGQLIRRLDLGHQVAGSYTSRDRAVYWDGRNQSGERVSSGVYLYHLQAGSYSAIKRMLIVK